MSGNLGEDLGHVDLTEKAPSHVNLTVSDCKIRRLAHGQDAYSVAAPDDSCRDVKLGA